jgi:hypothetical protein
VDTQAARATSGANALPPLRLVAVVVAQRGQVALLLGEQERWQVETACTFMPLELPGGAARDGEGDLQALERIARERLGLEVGRVRVMAGRWVYGPSAAHAIDRRPMGAGPDPQPLVELTRSLPVEDAGRITLRPVVVRAYRCAFDGTFPSRLLWLGPGALRVAVRGMLLSDLLHMRSVECELPDEDAPPDDALVFVPSEYAERYLLRVAAKYGPEAVFGEERDDELR